MSAIFSVQNLQTFLRRKNFRPPSRGGPPGPERPPPPPPPNRGRSPPPERSPKGRDGRSVAGAFVSSVITLLNQWPVVGDQWPVKSLRTRRQERVTDHWPLTTSLMPLPEFPLPAALALLPPLQPAAHSLSSSRREAS